MPLIRPSLRRSVREAILEKLLDGELPPSSRVNESSLAKSLGVSQTPIREALLGLESDGLLESAPGRGFLVRAFDVKEMRELYSLVGLLEAHALQKAGSPNPATLRRLDQLNEQIRRCESRPRRAHELDTRWHQTLLAHSTNQRLHRTLEGLKLDVARYEFAYLRDIGNLSSSADQHAEIEALLENGELEAACQALENNWTGGIPAIAEWLRDTEQDQ